MITTANRLSAKLLEPLVPIVLFAARLWVAWIFFRSGLLKIDQWQSTLYLFQLEYQVPLLPHDIAAYLATAAELILPPLLVIGLLSRPVAVMLFVFNAVAVISYPELWQSGFYDHQLWGALILMVVLWGPGSISVDHWLAKRELGRKPEPAQPPKQASPAANPVA